MKKKDITILLVDDEQDILEIVGYNLEQEGYQIITASDGKEAIAKARKADILAAVEVEDAAEKLFKAVGELAPEAFADVIEVVKSLSTKVEKSLFFTEQGTKAEGEKVAKSALRAAIENKHTKQ